MATQQENKSQQPQPIPLTPEQQGLKNIKNYLNSDGIMQKFQQLLGKKSVGFITSVLQIVANNEKLAVCDVQSLYNAAATAATLDLPINPNLQFAHIVPYKQWREVDGNRFQISIAEFQCGWRGYIQLGQRTGQYSTINVTDVREGEVKKFDRLTGDVVFEWVDDEEERNKKKIIGYVSYFRLKSGFEKCIYWPLAKILAHGEKYSKTYKKADSRWKTDEDAMCRKTMIKKLLGDFGPMSVDVALAIAADQSEVISLEEGKFHYPDNPIADAPREEDEQERRSNQANNGLNDLENKLGAT